MLYEKPPLLKIDGPTKISRGDMDVSRCLKYNTGILYVNCSLILCRGIKSVFGGMFDLRSRLNGAVFLPFLRQLVCGVLSC